jgi:hypothetical protein
MTSEAEGMLAGGIKDYVLPTYGAKLVKNSKGYTWEVSARGEIQDAVLADLFRMDGKIQGYVYVQSKEATTE